MEPQTRERQSARASEKPGTPAFEAVTSPRAKAALEAKQAPRESATRQIFMSYIYMALWITLSSSVILYNKYVLSFSGFPYPISLTMIHMGFCSLLSALILKLGFVEGVAMSASTYLRCVIPVGALFACVLWLGNTAYLYLSVSFIQMLKASMPVAVFLVGVVMKTEAYTHLTCFNMLIVGTGICIASYGEINFVLLGVLLQIGSICAESLRLTLVQILLQSQGIKLNPITTMYYISPVCFLFLTIPFTVLEAPKLAIDRDVTLNVPLLLSNAGCAFALNLAVFLLIGKTSALTMNIAGVLKDWLLILLSVLLFTSPVTTTNLVGYSIAFGGVWWYNRRRVAEIKHKAEKEEQQASTASSLALSQLADQVKAADSPTIVSKA